MEKKEINEGESSTTKPEFEEFFELVDREAFRLQLMDQRRNMNSQNKLANNIVAWQPKFEIEDFKIPNLDQTKVHVELIDGEKSEMKGPKDQKLTRGTKRARETTPLDVNKKEKQKMTSSREMMPDLNRSNKSTNNKR